MKIFVTVGTTPFDSLIEFLDKNLIQGPEVVFQISRDAKYIPQHFTYFDFVIDIQTYYEESDLIITHAGAGSIYNLLELKKKIIIVPNLDRVDQHQTDIADYMHTNQYAITCYDYNDIIKNIINYNSAFNDIVEFEKEEFYAINEISVLIKKLYVL